MLLWIDFFFFFYIYELVGCVFEHVKSLVLPSVVIESFQVIIVQTGLTFFILGMNVRIARHSYQFACEVVSIIHFSAPFPDPKHFFNSFLAKLDVSCFVGVGVRSCKALILDVLFLFLTFFMYYFFKTYNIIKR